jgi:hypothetical protein
VINRRVFLAPALPIEQGKKHDADVKKLLPTLDIGSHINARHELLPKAGATQERTLLAVSSTALFGVEVGTDIRLPSARRGMVSAIS